ncbi:MAG: serine/threonine-protein phosphatase [Deltaproteobacteria bacterium]|nr:serine/threonine-protein phosphatase [Deltaproteobacteria bacterium]
MANDRFGIYLLCDGMGGPAGGDFASDFTSKQMMDTLIKAVQFQFSGKTSPDEPTMDILSDFRADSNGPASYIEYAVWETGQKLHRIAVKKSKNGLKMGTTLVGLWFLKDKVWSFNVGDSRAYGFWDNQLFRMTRDDCWVDEQILMGKIKPEDAPHYRSKITNAIGTQSQVVAQINSYPIHYSGGRFLLCSDGFYDHVPLREMTPLVSIPDMGEACEKMIEKALELGEKRKLKEDGDNEKIKKRDNITVLLIDLKMYGVAHPDEDTLDFE